VSYAAWEPRPSLWWWSLKQPFSVVERCGGLVATEERVRAARYATAALRAGKLVGWAGLRLVLGRALDQDPRRIRLGRAAGGKPFLVEGGLGFNLAHTRDTAVCALWRGGAVGVDIEASHPDPEAALWTAATAHERLWCAAVEGEERARRLLTVWIRKEAYLKALGVGLAAPMTSACFCRLAGTAGQMGPWRTRDFSLTADLTGSVCWHAGGRDGERPDRWEGGCARPLAIEQAMVIRALPLAGMLAGAVETGTLVAAPGADWDLGYEGG